MQFWNSILIQQTVSRSKMPKVRYIRFLNYTYRQYRYLKWGWVRYEELLRQITQTEAVMIPHILREPNWFIVCLYFQTFPLKKPFVFSRIGHKQHKLVWRHKVV